MKINLTKTLVAAALAVAVMPCLSAQAAPAPAPAAKPAAAPVAKPTLESLLAFLPDTLAEINGKKLTKKEFIQMMADSNVAPEMLAQFPQDLLKNLLAQQVSEMVDQMVFEQLAEKNGFKPSAELVKKELDRMYAKMDPQQKEMLNSQFKAQGKTFEAYRDEAAKDPGMQKHVAMQAFLASAMEKVKPTVSDADVEKFYRDNQKTLFVKPGITVSHILAKAMPTDDNGKPLSAEAAAKQDADAKAKIDGIYAKLKQGAKFEDLAAKESDCPSGAQSQGKLPSFDESGRMAEGGAMDPTFVQACLKLQKPQEISEPVKTPFGYHIIRLEEKKSNQFIPLAEVKDGIKAQLTNQKVAGEIQKMVENAKKEMKVKVSVQAAPIALPPAPAK